MNGYFKSKAVKKLDEINQTRLRWFFSSCLLYSSDAADDRLCVELGCRRDLSNKDLSGLRIMNTQTT
ncbi:hypothetical protein JP0567_13870 [Helicobacter pylori]